MLVSVIVPAYKQEKTIEKNVRTLFDTLSQTRWDFELIVVVDGKVDKTFENASKIKDPKVHVFAYEHNKGKGYAVKYGMGKAKGELISFIDAGTDIDPNGISMLLEHMQWYDADIIVGSKKHPVSKVNYPFLRRIYSFGYYLLVRLLFGLKLRDTQTGLKVFKREVLEKVLPRLVVKQFAFDIELLTVAYHLGFNRIYEAPVRVEWDFKQGTSFTLFLFLDPHIRAMLYDTVAIFYRMKFLRYYDEGNKRKWVYDKELDMRVNTGEVVKDA